MPNVWPLVASDNTSYRTPHMRMDAIREFAARSTGVDGPDQRQLTDQLARQIQIEPDPLVRETIIETIAEFRTPLAQQVLQAGLADEEHAVRIACCRGLGKTANPTSVASLSRTLQRDDHFDVRLAAAAALGQIRTPESVQALTAALDDRDPAMQFVGVASMTTISGRDFEGNVQAARQFAASQGPPGQPATAIAGREQSQSAF